uniref:Uncharacterized protein n=1 Tax=Trichuris muris TaxID=70415 RepID=A0A5S6QNG6_TRIMR
MVPVCTSIVNCANRDVVVNWLTYRGCAQCIEISFPLKTCGACWDYEIGTPKVDLRAPNPVRSACDESFNFNASLHEATVPKRCEWQSKVLVALENATLLSFAIAVNEVVMRRACQGRIPRLATVGSLSGDRFDLCRRWSKHFWHPTIVGKVQPEPP